MRIGLVRKYDNGNELARKIETLIQEGCQEYRVEKREEEGITYNELKEIVGILEPGDELMVYELADLGLTLIRLVEFFPFLKSQKIKLIVHESQFTTGDDIDCYIEFIKMLEQSEKSLSRESVMVGLTKAKKKGRVGGRPGVSAETIAAIKKLHKTQKYSYRAIAEECGVSLGTVTKYVKN